MPIMYRNSYFSSSLPRSCFVHSPQTKALHETSYSRTTPAASLFNALFLLTILMYGCFLSSPAAAARITLAWSASSGSVEGYRLYYRSTTTPGTAILPAPPGLITSTTYTTPDLPAGTYYFKVKAFGTGDRQSGFSNEAKAIIPAQPIEQTSGKITNSPTPASSSSKTTASLPEKTASTESGASAQNPTLTTERLKNLSTRGWVGTGDEVMIVGFGITGASPKQVLIRAIGPSLAKAGISNLLYDPALTLHKGQDVLARNDNWQDQQAAAITATSKAPQDAQEAAILITLNPGLYTAIVRGVSDTTGNALVEIFETGPTESLLTNLSTRGRTEARDGVMIAGFIVGGTHPKRVLIRAIGPTLSAAGVSDALADPTLTLYRGQTVIANNDNWRTDQASAIEATGKAPGDPRESALVTTLQPGPYTAIVRGTNAVAGNILIDVHDLRE